VVFKLISSAQNEQYRLMVRAASEPRFRRKHGYMWIEGPRLVLDFLARADSLGSRWQPVALVVSESLQASDSARQASLQCAALDREPAQLVLSDALYGGLSQLVHGPGMALLTQLNGLADDATSDGSMNLAAAAGRLPAAGSGQPGLPDVVLLDRVSDPGNLGGLLRSAAAAGCRQAWLMKGSAEAHSPKALRAGMGAQFGMVIREDLEMDQLEQSMAEIGGQLVLTVAADNSGAVSLHQASWLGDRTPLVWAFGQEGSGLSSTLLDWPAARALTIDQSDAVESLNVNAAAAVCLFERRRRLA
jgi:RNA methyltransferase, TrmH family